MQWTTHVDAHQEQLVKKPANKEEIPFAFIYVVPNLFAWQWIHISACKVGEAPIPEYEVNGTESCQ